jgi:pimeloyl-ACP methyl ester carboxylesterase
MRSRSTAPRWSATTGAGAPPASWRRNGPSACAAWSPATATTCRTSPEQEHRFWYQYYFHTERGRAGLTANRRAFCRLIWRLWSPNWTFDEATFERSACSFDNPDFVDVTIQSYRHRYGNAPGDPALEPIEQRLAARPTIAVPTIVLHGEADGVGPPETSAAHARFFSGAYQRRLVPLAGHNLPQEVPDVVTAATLGLIRAT